MAKLKGYAGKLLRVDLTNETFTDVPINEEMARKYIGGTGFGVKVMYDEVPAEVAWHDEDNRWVIASGPLGGTTIGGSGTVSVVTKGPMTNGVASSQANGFFGVFLRFCGYEGIIIQGKAKRWSYLHISDEGVELKDASHLIGKDTWETKDIIQDELEMKERGISVAAIGPAGENLVKFAPVVIDKDHVPSKNGNGAVLASKQLKAIAVERGKNTITLHDPEALKAVAKEMKDEILTYPFCSWGTTGSFADGMIAKYGMMPIRNLTTTISDFSDEKLNKFGSPYTRTQHNGKKDNCWACPANHCHTYVLSEEST